MEHFFNCLFSHFVAKFCEFLYFSKIFNSGLLTYILFYQLSEIYNTNKHKRVLILHKLAGMIIGIFKDFNNFELERNANSNLLIIIMRFFFNFHIPIKMYKF